MKASFESSDNKNPIEGLTNPAFSIEVSSMKGKKKINPDSIRDRKISPKKQKSPKIRLSEADKKAIEAAAEKSPLQKEIEIRTRSKEEQRRDNPLSVLKQNPHSSGSYNNTGPENSFTSGDDSIDPKMKQKENAAIERVGRKLRKQRGISDNLLGDKIVATLNIGKGEPIPRVPPVPAPTVEKQGNKNIKNESILKDSAKSLIEELATTREDYETETNKVKKDLLFKKIGDIGNAIKKIPLNIVMDAKEELGVSKKPATKPKVLVEEPQLATPKYSPEKAFDYSKGPASFQPITSLVTDEKFYGYVDKLSKIKDLRALKNLLVEVNETFEQLQEEQVILNNFPRESNSKLRLSYENAAKSHGKLVAMQQERVAFLEQHIEKMEQGAESSVPASFDEKDEREIIERTGKAVEAYQNGDMADEGEEEGLADDEMHLSSHGKDYIPLVEQIERAGQPFRAEAFDRLFSKYKQEQAQRAANVPEREEVPTIAQSDSNVVDTSSTQPTSEALVIESPRYETQDKEREDIGDTEDLDGFFNLSPADTQRTEPTAEDHTDDPSTPPQVDKIYLSSPKNFDKVIVETEEALNKAFDKIKAIAAQGEIERLNQYIEDRQKSLRKCQVALQQAQACPSYAPEDAREAWQIFEERLKQAIGQIEKAIDITTTAIEKYSADHARETRKQQEEKAKQELRKSLFIKDELERRSIWLEHFTEDLKESSVPPTQQEINRLKEYVKAFSDQAKNLDASRKEKYDTLVNDLTSSSSASPLPQERLLKIAEGFTLLYKQTAEREKQRSDGKPEEERKKVTIESIKATMAQQQADREQMEINQSVQLKPQPVKKSPWQSLKTSAASFLKGFTKFVKPVPQNTATKAPEPLPTLVQPVLPRLRRTSRPPLPEQDPVTIKNNEDGINKIQVEIAKVNAEIKRLEAEKSQETDKDAIENIDDKIYEQELSKAELEEQLNPIGI